MSERRVGRPNFQKEKGREQNMAKKSGGGKWIQKAIKRPGAFRAKAKRAGMSTSEFANHVLANKDKYDTRTIRQAVLAKTLAKLRKRKK
jgi:hypothetical protein